MKWYKQKEKSIPRGSNIMFYTKWGGVAEGEVSSKDNTVYQYRWNSKMKLEDILLWSEMPTIKE